ncbi:MAG: DNA translocase FtsK 4TM domain-containing protein [Rhodospirillales bacterium]
MVSWTGTGGILPDGTIDFFKRRLCEVFGLALIALSLLLATALATFSPADPSFNTAAAHPPQNRLGLFGAFAADGLLQSFGLAGALPLLAFLVWGWKLLRKKPMKAFWLRLALLCTATTAIAVALAALPAPASWPLSIGLGGLTGGLILPALAAIHPVIDRAWVGLIAFVIGFIAFLIASNLSWSDWRSGMRTVSAGAGRLAALGPPLQRSPGAALEKFTDKLRGLFRLSMPVKVSLSFPNDEKTARREPSFKPGAAEDAPAPSVAAPVASRLKAKAPEVAPSVPRVRAGRREAEARQGKLDITRTGEYQFPPLNLLEAPSAERDKSRLSQDALQQNAIMLSNVLEEFGVRGEIIKVRPGPVVTLYELEPAPGTKTSRVIGLADDIARSMSAVSVRVAVVPGRNAIGIELPNNEREMVYLREILASEAMDKVSGKLNLAVGKDIGGKPVIVDLARMPHLLIAGTTGSGKSVAINTMILSLLYQLPPDQCKLIMIDPKMLELSVYEGIPHLITPVVTEPGKAVMALKWAVREMEDRYRLMSQLGVRNVAGYNKRIAEVKKKGEPLTRRVQTGFDETGKPVFEDQPLSMEQLPLIVIVVDEMADLMLVAGKDIEAAVQRLAQMARAAGLHLIMATQRPSVDVITGMIKANFPTRISFQVTSKIDSRTILGEQGAEQLLGQGDMLYMEGGGRITRIHGPFVSDEEVENIVTYLKDQGEPTYLEEITEEAPEPVTGIAGGGSDESSGDELYDEAVALIAREGKASTSFIQRYLQIGYNRAARIIERMEKEGIVSKANRVGRREVLIGQNADLAS